MARSFGRREFMSVVGAAAAWPIAARAQQRALVVVGYLHPSSGEQSLPLTAAFRKGLSEAGYIEGRNLAIESRFADNEFDRLPELAADLVRHQVAIIAAPGAAVAARAAKAATTTIPIVFSMGEDPVQAGLVASLNRPGGNLTGFTSMNVALGAKRLGLLHELLPSAKRYAALVNPSNPLITEPSIKDLQTAAAAIGRDIEIINVSNYRDIDAAFLRLGQSRPDMLLITNDTLFSARRVQLAGLAIRYALPTMFYSREDSLAGGLMSYGTSLTDLYRQVGLYCARILNGEKPADLPVLRATKFEFVINLQTARTLDLKVPATLLALADEVIE